MNGKELVHVPTLKSTTPMPAGDYPTEKVWLTLERDIEKGNKGSKELVVRVFYNLCWGAQIAHNSFTSLEDFSKATGVPVNKLLECGRLARAAALCRHFGRNVIVEHEWSRYVNGEYVTARLGNHVLGITFNGLKDSPTDVIRSGRIGQTDPIFLAAGGGATKETPNV